MFSQSAKYAIKAVFFLSVYADENKFSFKEIAASIDTPTAFTAKVLQELSRKDLVSSFKGKKGGFYLTAA